MTKLEVEQVLSSFRGRHAERNRALFVMLFKTGFRISEALSLWIPDVVQHGQVVDVVSVTKQNMKGKARSRSVPLHQTAKDALRSYLDGEVAPTLGKVFPITRQTAWRALDEAFKLARIPHPFGTHSGRKTFAQSIYERSGHDYLLTSKALGHASIATTQAYLSVSEDRLRKIITGD